LAVAVNVDQNTEHGLFFATDLLGKKIKIGLKLLAFLAIVHLYEGGRLHPVRGHEGPLEE
jgi:hypothetical protein